MNNSSFFRVEQAPWGRHEAHEWREFGIFRDWKGREVLEQSLDVYNPVVPTGFLGLQLPTNLF